MLTTAAVMARLQVVRRSRGLSTRELAERAGMTRSVISHLECGYRKSLTLDELASLCAALGVDPIQVLSGQPTSI